MTKNKHIFTLSTLAALFFAFGFITVLNDILVPRLKMIFELSYFEAALIQFCFFGAYFITGAFWGKIIEKIGYPNSIILGFLIAAFGCFLFYPVAEIGSYPMFLAALFILASGIVLLQAVGNPFVTLLSPGKEAANLTLVQAFNSLGTTIGPIIGSIFILNSTNLSQFDNASSVEIPYLCIGVALVLLAIFVHFLKLPDARKIAEKVSLENGDKSSSLWEHRHFILGAFAIFCYVGAEVSIGSFLINTMDEVANIAQDKGAKMIAIYWGLAMVGRFLGGFLLKKIAAFKYLCFNACFVILLLVSAIIMHSSLSIYLLIAIGFFNSIMFTSIFTLATSGLGRLTSRASGMICVAIVGGAILPPMQGFCADLIGLLPSFFIPMLCYMYIAYFAIFGRKGMIVF